MDERSTLNAQPSTPGGALMDAGVAWLSVPLAVMCLHRAAVALAWMRSPQRADAADTGARPPVTWLRPLKPGVPELPEKLERFLAAMDADDEVIFGIEAGSAEARTCESLAARDARVKVVTCEPGAAANPKVSKLIQMTPQARHERWILADAEAWIDDRFAHAFRHEWETSGAEVLTAGYRFVGMRSVAQWLDALAVVQTLWPGLELVRAFARLSFTLGACTGVCRSDLEAIGGWAALGNELAEDRQLGARLAALGRSVQLSTAVLRLESEPMTWLDYWRHQQRVAVTYRVATPAGALGMILTRGFSLCAVLALIFPCPLTLANVNWAAFVHTATVALQARRIGGRLGWWVFWGMFAELVETVCWGLSWFSRRVWWGGKRRAITWRGQIRTQKGASDR